MGPETHRLSVDNMLNLARSPDKVVVFERRDRSADLTDVNSRDLQIRLIDGVEAYNSLSEIGWCDPWFKNHQTPRLNMASMFRTALLMRAFVLTCPIALNKHVMMSN